MSLCTDSISPRDQPGLEDGLAGEDRGKEWGVGVRGLPAPPPLIFLYFVYVTYDCRNLGPREAVRCNGNLELVAFRIILPGGLGALQGEHRSREMGPVTARREPARGPGVKGSACSEAPGYTSSQGFTAFSVKVPSRLFLE